MTKVTVEGVDAASIVVSIISKEAAAVSRELANRLASRFAGRVRAKIIDQEESWHPLSPDYLKRKLRERLSPKILVARYRYVDTIRAREIAGSSKLGGFEVAPGPNPIAGGETATFVDLGVWHEFGTRNADGSVRMPARPHFRPTWREFKRELKEQVVRFGGDMNDIVIPKVGKGLSKTKTRVFRV